MKSATAETRAQHLPGRAQVLLALVLLASLLLVWQTRRVVVVHQQQRFDAEVLRLESAIEQRMDAYMQILRGARGMVEASEHVSREDWHDYVRALRLRDNYPGIRAMSYVSNVAPQDLDAFVRRVRQESPAGFSDPLILRDFKLRAPPPPIEPVTPAVHAVVLYTEPLTADSERALGIDMMQDAGRRTVLEAAIRRDDAVLAPKLQVLSAKGSQTGFIACMPVYRNGRQVAWVNANFHAQAFMEGLLGKADGPLAFEVFDGSGSNPQSLLYAVNGRAENGMPRWVPALGHQEFEVVRTLQMPGRQWTARFRSTPGFSTFTERLMPWLVGFAGLMSSLFLYMVARGAARWRQQAELLEHAQREVEAAAQAKSDFLANMSHEIRTPLNAILGTAELLGDTSLEGGQRRSLDTIMQSGDHLLGIVNDILDFSKIEAGMLVLDEQVLDLRRTVDEALALLAARAAAKGLDLRAEFAPAMATVLRADHGRVRQVLLNYLSNAVKFTERGSIVVTVAAEPLDATHQRVRIAVRDTGIGIAAENCARLFQSFTQADASTTRRYGGTGLGLAICKRLAECMGGGVAVDSTPGVGSEFSFTFVAASEPAWQQQPTETAAPPSLASAADLQVLLVEDNTLNQQVAMQMLASLGCVADSAADGQAAVEAVQRRDYDLVLMDVQMPVMDGLEATRRIRALADRRQPHICAMSASVLDEERQACIDAGMDRHLSKPFRRAELAALLDDIAGARAHSAASTVAGADDFDRATWAELRELFGSDGVLRLCDTLVADLPVQRGRLAEALRDDDPAAFKRLAHALRGVSLQLGASALAAQWLQAEQTATDGDVGALQLGIGLIERHAALVQRICNETTEP